MLNHTLKQQVRPKIISSLETIYRLYPGAHFVILRSDEKRPAHKGWNYKKPALKAVLAAIDSGKEIGLIPASINKSVIDIDEGNSDALLKEHEPLMALKTKKADGRHAVYDLGESPPPNRNGRIIYINGEKLKVDIKVGAVAASFIKIHSVEALETLADALSSGRQAPPFPPAVLEQIEGPAKPKQSRQQAVINPDPPSDNKPAKTLVKRKQNNWSKPVVVEAKPIHAQQQSDLFRSEITAEMSGTRYCMDRYKNRPSGNMLKRQTQRALEYPYVQVNPPWMAMCLTFDIDRPGGADAWRYADLPEPLATVTSRETGRAHIIYALASPVLLGEKSQPKPRRLLAAIEGAMGNRLGADPAYNGLLTKNPLNNKEWEVWWSLQIAKYQLMQLSACLTDEEIYKYWPRKGNINLSATGRKMSTFIHTRLWAYRAINKNWDGSFNAWQEIVIAEANRYNKAEHKHPLPDIIIRSIGRSVARFSWKEITKEGFIEIQRYRGQQSGRKRRAANIDRDAIILQNYQNGQSYKSIARDFGLTDKGIRKIIRRDNF